MMGGGCLWVLLPLLAACTASYVQYPGYTYQGRQLQQQQHQYQLPGERSCPGNLPLAKLMFNQSNYIQYVHYYTDIPDISSFTIQYWFNLIDTNRTSTTFDYTRENEGNKADTIIIQLAGGNPQKWNLIINENIVCNVVSPLVKAGEWHHMVHSWDSKTGSWSIYMDGTLLGAALDMATRGIVVPGGGLAVSGQHQISTAADGMDRNEGLEGWFTLLQMSHRPLLDPRSYKTTAFVAQLTQQCDGESHGDILSWTRTPRKGYGGSTEAPSQKVCGHF